jgi:hypothetical protein
MDAPLITLDPAANTTDVYAFRSASENEQYLTTALAVYPFEEPGIGPNNYSFDDNVLYEIHIALDGDVLAGRPTISYQFEFDTRAKNGGTILQSFLGVLVGDIDADGFDVNQNRRQTYRVTLVDHREKKNRKTVLGTGRVPPNNQGLVTPFYNQDNDGENPAKDGVASEADLDPYTQRAIVYLQSGHRIFAGQRDDGFYADIQSIFDLDFGFGGLNKPFDSQGGFNVHTIVLQIPLRVLGDATLAGVYATTSRRRVTIFGQPNKTKGDLILGDWVQVGRQGNPLFAEALIALADKDLYNRTKPSHDRDLFAQYALAPELATVLRVPENLRTNRTDIAAIFIPDLIKVDLTTSPVPLAGDVDFHRLSVFAGDTGGWPNGRRFGDDVLDIAVCAILSDLRDSENLQLACNATSDIDRVMANDITYNSVMPYAATPLNGRNHGHH